MKETLEDLENLKNKENIQAVKDMNKSDYKNRKFSILNGNEGMNLG
jgi:hypothetical protein